MTHGRRRRHRQFSRHVHAIHRLRLRPVGWRGGVHRHHAHRHRRDARSAVLELERRRRHHCAAGEEDAVRRRLRLSHRQLEQPREDRLRQFRRPGPESIRHGFHRAGFDAARQGGANRPRRSASAARLHFQPYGLGRLLRELHSDRVPAVRLGARHPRLLHPRHPAFRDADRVQIEHAGRLRADPVRPVRQDRLHGRARAWQRDFQRHQSVGLGGHRRHWLDAVFAIHARLRRPDS